MKQLHLRRLVLVLVILAFTSCVAFQPQVPETPKEKSDFFMSYYLAQKADYETRLMIATEEKDGVLYWKAGTTDVEAAILEAKHAFITEAETPITMYDSYASKGELPPAELEMTINALMSRLKDYLSKH